MYSLTSGFLKTAWSEAPETDRAAPTARPRRIRGRRMPNRMSLSAGVTDPRQAPTTGEKKGFAEGGKRGMSARAHRQGKEKDEQGRNEEGEKEQPLR